MPSWFFSIALCIKKIHMSGVRREVVDRRGETQEVSFSLEHTWKVSFHEQNEMIILY